jgi:hypothetical protein
MMEVIASELLVVDHQDKQAAAAKGCTAITD